MRNEAMWRMANILRYVMTVAVLYLLTVWSLYGDGRSEIASAQTQSPNVGAPEIRVRFVPDSIAIGDRFSLEVEITKDIMQVIAFPEFNDNMIGGVLEISAEGEIDTLSRDGRRVTLSKRYELTTFEDGMFGFGHFPMLYADKNIVDTIWSIDSMFLRVGTFDIDTTNSTIYDIKGLKRVPLRFGEIWLYLLLGVLFLAAVGVVVWIIFTRRRNLSLLGKPKPVILPHVAAIRALEVVHSQKLWQKSDHKQYYTRITDILREYIEARYGIAAKEMTSDEIVNYLAHKELPERSYTDLKEILRMADLVKFAKGIPDAESNENAYTNSYYFVERTKMSEVEEVADEEERS